MTSPRGGVDSFRAKGHKAEQRRNRVEMPSNMLGRARPGKRLNLNVTVHPDTLDRLAYLCQKFATSRGQLIDKLVNVLDSAYKSGKLMCIHGQVCQIGRSDLPEIY